MSNHLTDHKKVILFGIYKKALLLVCLSGVVFFSLPLAASEKIAADQSLPTLVVNTTGKPPMSNEEHSGFVDQLATEAFRRCGIKLVIDHLPAERALRNANKGIIDGDLMRIKGLDKIYPNLIRVPEKLVDWYFVAYSKKAIDLSKGWQSLANRNVAIITGWKIYEKNVPKTADLAKVRNAEQLFKLISRNRTDVVLYNHSSGQYLLKKLGIQGITEQSPPLATKEMFIYLNKKHSRLVPKLAKALADMKADGTYDRITKSNVAALSDSDK